jgi:hypothetical protein
MKEEIKQRIKALNPENEAKFKTFLNMFPLYAMAAAPAIILTCARRRGI